MWLFNCIDEVAWNLTNFLKTRRFHSTYFVFLQLYLFFRAFNVITITVIYASMYQIDDRHEFYVSYVFTNKKEKKRKARGISTVLFVYALQYYRRTRSDEPNKCPFAISIYKTSKWQKKKKIDVDKNCRLFSTVENRYAWMHEK